jgi:hypothetical protein
VFNPFANGYAGNVDAGYFVFDADAIKGGQHFEVCVESSDDDTNTHCEAGTNHIGRHIETIYVQAPTGIGRESGVTYNDNA